MTIIWYDDVMEEENTMVTWQWPVMKMQYSNINNDDLYDNVYDDLLLTY